MFRILEDEPKVLPDLYFLDSFIRCEEILRWLIANRLTGKDFLEWRNYLFGNSQLEMVQFILSKLDKSEKQPIFYGKDFYQ